MQQKTPPHFTPLEMLFLIRVYPAQLGLPQKYKIPTPVRAVFIYEKPLLRGPSFAL